jgi:hypothetical protein
MVLVLPKRNDDTPTYVVGDYVTLKDPECRGIVYKVDEVHPYKDSPSLSDYRLRPVYGAFGAAERRGNRSERGGDMVKVDVVRAGLEYLKMQDFIKNLARHYGMEPPDGSG